MGTNTRIEWTDATWNPVTGCSKVSPGCEHCYAERISHRFGRTSLPWTGPNAAQNVRLHPDRLGEPLRWRKPRKVFVCSMSDLFHERVPDEFIAAVFGTMALASAHTFQVLTKRPRRMAELVTRLPDLDQTLRVWVSGGGAWPLPNVWLGVTAEDQRRADERIPLLLETPAAVRFVSCEPMLGPIELVSVAKQVDRTRIDWVIVGGESGPGARPMHPDWVRSIRDQCQAAGVPFFFKQWGEWLPNDQEYGANPGDFDYERPHVMVGNVAMCRVGKKRAGRLLDGRTWDEMPRVTQREAV